MSVVRPDLLVLAPTAAVLLVLLVTLQWWRGRRLVAAYGGPVPARRLLDRDLGRFPAVRILAGTLGAVALALAAVEPATEDVPTPPPPVPLDLLVAVDVSHSMSATDVAGSRIERARALVTSLVEEGTADRIALSVFADWPFGLAPLTHDGDVVTFFGPWITSELMGARDQGTSLATALGQARAAWERRPREDARRVVLLVSDGEIHDGHAEVMDSVAAVADAGFEIWTAGVGTDGGAPLFVPGSDGAPLLYDGQAVLAGYDERLLRDIAERGRGAFRDVSTDGGARSLVDALAVDQPVGEDEADDAWNLARWLLLAALVLLLAEMLADGGVFELVGRGGPARPRGSSGSSGGHSRGTGLGARRRARVRGGTDGSGDSGRRAA